ncbi:RNA polymerase factor sigma-54 [Ruminococcaceae bacterium OttesenSCG-928-A16]|nr:RNA polymerase factor sigma-54 [Ruminococcaceae bacterium OttesenSCG-928-A16]
MKITHKQRQIQQQILSQNMRQSLEMLQMPLAELQQYLQEAVLSNPLLDLDEGANQLVWEPSVAEPAPAEQDEDRWEGSASESPAAWETAHPATGDNWIHQAHEVFDFTSHAADPALQAESLTDALLEQLIRMQWLTEDMRALCTYLVECLDENGFLTFKLEELAAEQGVDLFAMQQALYILQDLEPAGVAARSLPECLVLQLARTKQFNQNTLRLVQHGLELLAKNDLPAMAKLLGCTEAVAKQTADAVRALNPRPAQGYADETLVAYQTPEAVFYCQAGEVKIETDRLRMLRLSLNQQNHNLLQSSSNPAEQAYLKEKMAEAQQLIQFTEERQNTLVRVLEVIAERQKDFFLKNEPLQVITISQLAEQLGFSISTISRAVQGKTIVFNGKTIPLKKLFTTAAAVVNGRELSAESIKQQLCHFIEAEDTANPLSDEALSAALQAVQMPISRRTVAKYREEAGIPPSSKRRVKKVK